MHELERCDVHSPHGKPPNFEANPNYGSSVEVQCTPELQRGYIGHFETHDSMEARLGGVQGPFKEDGMDYGGYSFNEC